ncbi:indolepyruvate ferredoxin oxidoreductase subunit alpha [Patulibacter minatonensis]|uniref:indolepyruvate ferredoxin oxidoreductase subunit alpha n=1 Tax=Patulibacter minatonensis TaxID=298163 RepID=UPI000478F558|nr:4Fe-4S binding protein [Patulibacter minatonensis]
MSYVITAPCINTRDASCVEVCPVDCIHPAPGEPGHETAEQLFIDPEECIGCDACVEVCPVGAPWPIEDVPAEHRDFVGIAEAYYAAAAADGGAGVSAAGVAASPASTKRAT